MACAFGRTRHTASPSRFKARPSRRFHSVCSVTTAVAFSAVHVERGVTDLNALCSAATYDDAMAIVDANNPADGSPSKASCFDFIVVQLTSG